MTIPHTPMSVLQAIAREEGYYATPPTRPERDNNPGDIEWHPAPHGFAFLHGATRPETMADGTPGRFAFFPTPEVGFAAMRALLGTPTYKGKTVAAALNIWAPPVENATNGYIANVCAWVPCKATDVIDGLLGV
jgi:hypothetical protein